MTQAHIVDLDRRQALQAVGLAVAWPLSSLPQVQAAPVVPHEPANKLWQPMNSLRERVAKT